MERLEKATEIKSVELRFIGLINSLERRKRILNHPFEQIYCPACDNDILADFQGGIVKDGCLKFLYYSCPNCFYPFIIRPEQPIVKDINGQLKCMSFP